MVSEFDTFKIEKIEVTGYFNWESLHMVIIVWYFLFVLYILCSSQHCTLLHSRTISGAIHRMQNG